MLRITVVSIFPGLLSGSRSSISIAGARRGAGAVELSASPTSATTRTTGIGPWTTHPYGGGAGMVMKPAPFFEAVEGLGAKPPIVLLSARGPHFTHADAVRYAAGEELTLLCGHYKDVDQRVADHLATEERSIGPTSC